jgi:hypothetical protein
MTDMAPFSGPSEEEKILSLLAQYDAQGVEDHKLRAIFNCTDANLAEARQQPFYEQALAAVHAEMQDRALSIDLAWDNAEATATKQLVDLMEFNADPRLSLLVAARANQAARRMSGNPLHKLQAKAAHGPAVIDPAALAGPTRTVRVRTKFAEILQETAGVKRLVEREVEITTTDTGSLDEGMSPSKLKGLMTRALGVDMEDVAVTHQSNSSDYGLTGVIDFSQIAMDGPE